MYWKRQCCNPFKKDNHDWSTRKMNLRRVTELMCEKISSLSVGLMICDSCRKQLYKVPYPSTQVGLQVSEFDSTDSTEIEYELPESLHQSVLRRNRGSSNCEAKTLSAKIF